MSLDQDTLKVGDRIKLYGGYDMEPVWLCGKDIHLGKVSSFIPGMHNQPAAVVKLDDPITVDGITGNIVVMELRHVGAKWTANETVGLELCDFEPEPKPWKQRRRGKGIESHVSYDRI
jgi:hypothetical protein